MGFRLPFWADNGTAAELSDVFVRLLVRQGTVVEPLLCHADNLSYSANA